MGAFRNLAGLRFGRLLVIKRTYSPYYSGNARWLCRCDCGNKKSIVNSSLVNGDTKSCGCLRREVLAKLRTTHGQSHQRTTGKNPSPEYWVWQALLKRCYNPNDKRYYCYGARGITVCARWRRSFKAFFIDMGPRPKGKTKNGRALYSIERINNNRGYSKKNCKWATIHEQAGNRRKRS